MWPKIALFTFKVAYPRHVHLARGNHETLNMNKIYGFEGEVKHKYSQQMFGLFTGHFECEHVTEVGFPAQEACKAFILFIFRVCQVRQPALTRASLH